MWFSNVLRVLSLTMSVIAVAGFDYQSIQLSDWEASVNPLFNFATVTRAPSARPPTGQCKSFPGDSSWVAMEDWHALNRTLDGALIKTVPLATPCNCGPLYDAAQCAIVQANFRNSSLHTSDPASVMSFWAEGATCMPANDSSSMCSLGGYPVYVVNASNVRHIQLAVNFARNTNIRLVIKNTGHDYLGKSTGAGALSVWTHHLKGLTYLPSFALGDYSGPAAKFGAGVQSFEVYDFAASVNATFVAPGGTTVGVFGGFMQGGGHSVISSMYGLAADHVLSMDVVTADGRLVTASSESDPGLFWAIRGGGGGSFGIVTSVIARALPVTAIVYASLGFDTATTDAAISVDVFWEGIEKLFGFLPRLCDDKGFSLIFLQSKTMLDLPTYSVSFSLLYPGKVIHEGQTAANFLLSELQDLGINITARFQYFSTVTDYFHQRGFGDSVPNSRYITRLFPRENFENKTSLARTVGAIKDTITAGYNVIAGALSPTLEIAGNPDNSVNPAWRRTILHAEAVEPMPDFWSPKELDDRHERMERWVQPWRDVSPGAGSYLNEADVQEPNWQQAFYGTNYPRLLAIKKKYDPLGVFYATTAVGSEEWQVRTEGDIPTQNGRLCRSQNQRINTHLV